MFGSLGCGCGPKGHETNQGLFSPASQRGFQLCWIWLKGLSSPKKILAKTKLQNKD
jgi:hypothetical protein